MIPVMQPTAAAQLIIERFHDNRPQKTLHEGFPLVAGWITDIAASVEPISTIDTSQPGRVTVTTAAGVTGSLLYENSDIQNMFVLTVETGPYAGRFTTADMFGWEGTPKLSRHASLGVRRYIGFLLLAVGDDRSSDVLHRVSDGWGRIKELEDELDGLRMEVGSVFLEAQMYGYSMDRICKEAGTSKVTAFRYSNRGVERASMEVSERVG